MVFSFRGASPIKTRVILVFAAVIIGVAALLGIFLLRGQAGDESQAEPVLTKRTSVGLGITYLPVTRPIAANYNLGVDSGALVTEIAPGSPAERAGVKAGDVILSFNGTTLDDEVPLLGMMMSCPAGSKVTLEVWRADNTVVVSLLHADR
jgi:S1-C subfamily serine protease